MRGPRPALAPPRRCRSRPQPRPRRRSGWRPGLTPPSRVRSGHFGRRFANVPGVRLSTFPRKESRFRKSRCRWRFPGYRSRERRGRQPRSWAGGQSSFGFRRSEEDQDDEFFADVVKAVLDLRPHEDHAAFFNRLVSCTRLQPRAPSDDVIHLVLLMRLLRIGGARGQHIDSGTHRGHAQKLVVKLAASAAMFEDFGELGKGMHGPRHLESGTRHLALGTWLAKSGKVA